jgi:hypothetical protein
MLKTVILNSFPSDLREEIDFVPCSSGDIINRQYFAYSVRSQGLISMIISLNEVLKQMLGEGSIHELFGIISEILEDYGTYYPLLDNKSNIKLGSNLVSNIKSKLELGSIKHIKEETLFAEIRGKLSLWMLLFALSNVEVFMSENYVFEEVPFKVMIISFLSMPNIVFPDLFIKVIVDNYSVSLHTIVFLDTLLNAPNMKCENIHSERPETEKDGNIKNCEEMKRLLTPRYSGKNMPKSEELL